MGGFEGVLPLNRGEGEERPLRGGTPQGGASPPVASWQFTGRTIFVCSVTELQTCIPFFLTFATPPTKGTTRATGGGLRVAFAWFGGASLVDW